MEKNCSYCGTGFSTNRENKKYCKDNCKQLAYLQRCGMVRSGNAGQKEFQYRPSTVFSGTSAVNDRKSVGDVKDVKAIKDVKPVKPVKDVNYIDQTHISPELIEELVSKISAAMELNLALAIEKIRTEFIQAGNHHPEETDKTTEPYCKTEPFAGFAKPRRNSHKTMERCQPDSNGFEQQTIKQPKEAEVIRMDELTGFKSEDRSSEKYSDHLKLDHEKDPWDEENEEDYEKEERGENVVTDIPEKLYCMELADDDQPQEQKENKQASPYNWLESKLIRKIEKNYTANNVELKFRYSHSHWDSMDAYSVAWVNVRLRCLLENLIRASNFNYIHREAFSLLAEAFDSLVNSDTYKSLPENYPFLEIVNELSFKLNRMEKGTRAAEIKIQLLPDKKALLIAMRQQLLSNTRVVRFAELHYEDQRNYYTPVESDAKKSEELKSDMEKDESNKPVSKGWEKRAEEAIKQSNLKKAS